MLLPCAVLDPLPFLSVPWLFIAPSLLGVLWPLLLRMLLLSVLCLLLLFLLLSMLLPVVLVLSLLLLSVLSLLLLFLLLGTPLLLSMLCLLLLFLLLSMLLLLSVLWLLLLFLLLRTLLFGLGLLALLLGMVLLFALLRVLCVSRSSDSEEQRQNGRAGESNYLHRCCLHYCWVRTFALAQASCRCINRVADGFTGYEKFHSPVLLPAGGVIVGGYRQSVAETLCTD